MSVAQREGPPDEALRIRPGPNRTWSGFGNLFRKELGQWWTTKLWWIQTLIWLALIDGIGTIVSLDTAGMTTAQAFTESTRTPFVMSVVVVGIGIVVTVQGAIIGEKDQGTAAWVMSKPVSRTSFVVSKIAAHFLGFLVTGVIIPSSVFALVSATVYPDMMDFGNYAVGVAVLALPVLFYVALTVCLDTVFKGRGPVAGIGVGFILTGQLLNGLLPTWMVLRTPWTLGDVAASFALDSPPGWSRMIPIAATVIGAVVFGAVAIGRFSRDEF